MFRGHTDPAPYRNGVKHQLLAADPLKQSKDAYTLPVTQFIGALQALQQLVSQKPMTQPRVLIRLLRCARRLSR